MAVAQTHMTLEKFLQLPEEKPALEFEDGMVSQKVSPKGKHSSLQYDFAEYINRQTVQRRLAKAYPELRASFSGRSYMPDVAVYRWDRIPRDEDGRVADDFFDAPDIAVEIVSPEQGVNALVRKCVWYVDHGVKIAILADPSDDSVVLFRPGKAPEALSGDDRIAFDEVLADFALTVRELFDSLYLG
jgi:Uma2 family endonuclease